jgi:hypothetical protein
MIKNFTILLYLKSQSKGLGFFIEKNMVAWIIGEGLSGNIVN